MPQEQTSLFDIKEIDTEIIRVTLREVYDSLEERGYNPTNQIVGYLISGDPGYISSYKDARKKILSINRSDLLAFLINEYLNKWGI